MHPERLNGKIKFFHGGGRYGFIYTESGQEYYYRENDVSPDVHELNSDDEVTFSVIRGLKGPRAIQIKKQGGNAHNGT